MATSERNVHKFMGQKLYKYDVKLSKRAQEVAGMPLINFNLTPGPASLTTTITKEPLKRTFSACTHHEGSMPLQSLPWQWPTFTQPATLGQSTLESMPETVNKPMLTEAMSMPLLQHNITLDEPDSDLELERLLPTDLLNDDDDFEQNSAKIPLRKTLSWTPEKLQFSTEDQESNSESEHIKNTTKKPELRQLEKAIKSLSIDPNMSISRKF